MVQNSYAARLQWAASAAKMSVSDLARAMDLTPQAVNKVMNGSTSYFTVPNHYQAAKILKVNPRWLGLGKGKPDAETEAPGADEGPILDLLDEGKLARLDDRMLVVLQGAMLAAAGQLGIDIGRRGKGRNPG